MEQEEQEQEEGPTAMPTSRQGTPTPILASSCSPAVSNVQGDVATLEATLHNCPGHSPSVPVPAEQDQPQEEDSERGAAAAGAAAAAAGAGAGAAAAAAAAGAGPSAQCCRCSPVAPGQDRDCFPQESRRPAKRKASGPGDSPQPPKRPSRRQRLRPRRKHYFKK